MTIMAYEGFEDSADVYPSPFSVTPHIPAFPSGATYWSSLPITFTSGDVQGLCRQETVPAGTYTLNGGGVWASSNVLTVPYHFPTVPSGSGVDYAVTLGFCAKLTAPTFTNNVINNSVILTNSVTVSSATPLYGSVASGSLVATLAQDVHVNVGGTQVNSTPTFTVTWAGRSVTLSAPTDGAWHYYEFLGSIAAGQVSVSARIDGGTVSTSTAVGIVPSGNANVGLSITQGVTVNDAGNGTFGVPAGTYFNAVDDLYMYDSLGASPQYLSRVLVYQLLPTGDGVSSQWTNDSGNSTANWSHVDSPSSQTSEYVSAASPNLTDLYQHAAIPTGVGTILAHQSSMYASGTGSVESQVREAGGVILNDPTVALTATPTKYLGTIRTTDSAAAPLTPGYVNGLQIGEESL